MGSLGGSFLNGQNAVKRKWMFLSTSPKSDNGAHSQLTEVNVR